MIWYFQLTRSVGQAIRLFSLRKTQIHGYKTREMNKGLSVSIIMPAYNASDFIREAVDSILAQTFGDFELIILNDGSTDDTQAIVESYDDERIRLVNKVEFRRGVHAE